MKPHPIPIKYRGMIIPKATFDRIQKGCTRPLLAGGLYLFYYYTAIWQDTNRPWCTTAYTATSMKVSQDIIRKTKKELMALGLIKDVIHKNKRGKITKHYIEVCFYEGIHPMENPEGGKTHSMENPEGNALSTNNLNALNTDSRPGKTPARRRSQPLVEIKRKVKARKGYSASCAQRLYDCLAQHRKIMRKPNLSQWTDIFLRLKEVVSKKELDETLTWYITNFGKEYIPQAYSAQSFFDKYPRIRDQMKGKQVDEMQRRWDIAKDRGIHRWIDERGRNCHIYADGSGECVNPKDENDYDPFLMGNRGDQPDDSDSEVPINEQDY